MRMMILFAFAPVLLMKSLTSPLKASPMDQLCAVHLGCCLTAWSIGPSSVQSRQAETGYMYTIGVRVTCMDRY